MTTLVRGEVAIAGERLEETGGERSIDALESLEEEHADGIALVGETVAARVGAVCLPGAWRAVWRGRSAAMPGSIGTGKSESVQHRRAEIGGGERGAGGDVGVADQSMHHRRLPRVIELKAWDPLSVGQGGGRSQFLELAADSFPQDVLLGIVVVVNDLGHALAQLRQVFDTFVDPIISDVIGGRLGS